MKISFCKTIMWQAIAVFAMVAGLSSCERDVAVTGVSLDKESITLKVGETQTLIATVTPDNATVKDVTWSSDDKAIATVDEEGNVKAVSEGTAFIVVTTVDGGKTAFCEVIVEPEEPAKPEEPVNIAQNFDPDFAALLVERGYIPDADSITKEQVDTIKVLDLEGTAESKLTSLKGIEYFTALIWLNVSRNNLTSLDVSKCTKLKSLSCGLNESLASLDISGCLALDTLSCKVTMLTTLDLTNKGYSNLKYLDASYCNLTSVNFAGNTELEYLDIDGHKLSSLDLSGCSSLVDLNCDAFIDTGGHLTDYGLTSINLSGCVSLKYIYIRFNRLTDMDVSDCTKLLTLECELNDGSDGYFYATVSQLGKIYVNEDTWINRSGVTTTYAERLAE